MAHGREPPTVQLQGSGQVRFRDAPAVSGPRESVDPETRTRYLEELAFEVVSEQNEKNARDKAPRMIRRGVRRVFAIFVKKGKVCEWSSEKGSWIELDRSSAIEDACLIEPLAVEALFDAAAADDAVASGLAARRNPVIERLRREEYTEGHAQGQAEGRAEAVLKVLEARGLAPDASLRRRILGTSDLSQLERWLERAALVASLDELLEP